MILRIVKVWKGPRDSLAECIYMRREKYLNVGNHKMRLPGCVELSPAEYNPESEIWECKQVWT